MGLALPPLPPVPPWGCVAVQVVMVVMQRKWYMVMIACTALPPLVCETPYPQLRKPFTTALPSSICCPLCTPFGGNERNAVQQAHTPITAYVPLNG